MLPKIYEPQTVEAKTYQFWEDNQLFKPEVNNTSETSFSIVIPPPNVTGNLHMGHALDNTIQDILIRWHRMLGDKTLWMPGTDHAGIATQSVVERQLQAEGTTKHDLGREDFIKRVWNWADSCKGNITGQLRRLGVSPDWERERFTLDEGCSKAVREAFVHLYEKGLIYQGEYIVNWDPVSQSAISDIETEYHDEDSHLWEIAYPVVDENGELTGKRLVVATTRPETMYGDVAVAVNPEDPRYKDFIGQNVGLPLTNKKIPIIADDYVDMAFGTGALKITPAHDPNDFKIGLKHQLDSIICIDEKGAIKALDFIPEALHGVDRFDARKQTEALLEAEGFLIRKLEHKHRVGRAQRSGAVIEPLLSRQWFVRTKPLAQTALKALEDGEIKFIPERWTKDYLRWMENIQDWCISRQLWWGHQIPAWTCDDCHELTVAKEDPTACCHCDSKNIKQDPDVLDTWFSSGLWPFSTMGWPDQSSQDLKDFYPTDVLVTGFDIIFFWVARMTMFGHEMTGKSPFHTVYIHGLIRDEKGQKMSKSKGNTIDPVETIDQYGCDGFRYALTSLITYGGQDIKLSKDKLEVGKLFANKLWNASRFTLMNLDNEDNGGPVDNQPIDQTQLSRMDQWILSRYNTTVQETNALLTDYKFSEVTQVLYGFIWNDFCDWYVEYAKKQLKNPELTANTKRILLHVLSGIIRLIHPVMPYISEEIYQKLPHQPSHQGVKSVSIASYPVADESLINLEINTQIDFVLETVRAVRNIRQQYKVPHQTPVNLTIEAPEAMERNAIKAGHEILNHFVKLDQVEILEKIEDNEEDKEGGKATGQSATNVIGHSRIRVPLEGIINVEEESSRLDKKMLTLKSEQEQLYKMMSNYDFLERAPQAVVEKNKARLNEVNKQITLLEGQLAGFN